MEQYIMHISQSLRVFFRFALVAILVLMPYAGADASSLPSIPPCFETKWDISKKGNVLEQEFYVSKHYVYGIEMSFKEIHTPASSEDKRQMREFIGNGT